MKNPKCWRKRTLEQEKERAARLQRTVVFSRITGEDVEEQLEMRNRIRKLINIPLVPSWKKYIRRLQRKIRRIENGTYR